MLGLGSELGIFSIDKIKLGFSIAKSMNRVDIIYSYEPNVGGFKKDFEKTLLECDSNILYDKESKTFTIPLIKDATVILCRKIHDKISSKYKTKVESDHIPREILSIIFKSQQQIENEQKQLAILESDLSRYIPEKLFQILYPYQKEGIVFATSKNFCCLIADGMGLGKSIQTICSIKVCKERYLNPQTNNTNTSSTVSNTTTLTSTSVKKDDDDNDDSDNSVPKFKFAVKMPVATAQSSTTTKATSSLANLKKFRILIICPSSLRVNWSEELKKWLPLDYNDQNIFCVFKNTDLQRFNLDQHEVLIISYTLAAKNEKLFQQIGFTFVVVDESHMLKNSKSNRTEKLTPILKAIRHRMLLSGTPAFARPMELYSQIQIVNGVIFPNYNAFGLRYCDGKLGKMVRTKNGSFRPWDFSGCSNSTELNLILKEKCMIRRHKHDVLTQLPSKIRTKLSLVVSQTKQIEKELKQMEAMLNSYVEENEEGEKVFTGFPEKDENIMQAYAKLANLKFPAIEEYFEEFYENEENKDKKILVFFHHKEMCQLLTEFFTTKVPMKFMKIDGETNPMKRGEYVKDFQENSETKVALLSITAAGVGLTLTAASIVFFTELVFTPGILVQAEDRAHRLTQKSTVNILYLLLKSSFEDVMWEIIQRKMINVSKILDNDHSAEGMKVNKYKKTESHSITTVTTNLFSMKNVIDEDNEKQIDQDDKHNNNDDNDDDNTKPVTKSNEIKKKQKEKKTDEKNINAINIDDEVVVEGDVEIVVEDDVDVEKAVKDNVADAIDDDICSKDSSVKKEKKNKRKNDNRSEFDEDKFDLFKNTTHVDKKSKKTNHASVNLQDSVKSNNTISISQTSNDDVAVIQRLSRHEVAAVVDNDDIDSVDSFDLDFVAAKKFDTKPKNDIQASPCQDEKLKITPKVSLKSLSVIKEPSKEVSTKVSNPIGANPRVTVEKSISATKTTTQTNVSKQTTIQKDDDDDFNIFSVFK